MDSLIQKVKAAQKDLELALKVEIEELRGAIFKENPHLESVSWTQYTPYFNDGDTCEFTVHSWLTTVDEDGNEEEDLESESGALQNLANVLDNSDLSSAFLQAFGDHARVTLTREGISVEEYDHD